MIDLFSFSFFVMVGGRSTGNEVIFVSLFVVDIFCENERGGRGKEKNIDMCSWLCSETKRSLSMEP